MATNGDDSGRISVSKDFLRAELTDMELRLVEKLATKAEVDNLAGRVGAIEENDSPTREEFDALKGWVTGMKAVLAVLVVAGPVLLHYFG